MLQKPIRQQPDEGIRKNREAHGKKPLKNDDNSYNNGNGATGGTDEKNVTEGTADPGSRLFHKGEYEKQFVYVANTACNRHNFVLDFVLEAGNIHDSQTLFGIY